MNRMQIGLIESDFDRFVCGRMTTVYDMQTFHPTTHDAEFDAEFEALLTTWNQHQELKAQAAPTRALWESNCTLSHQRIRVARTR